MESRFIFLIVLFGVLITNECVIGVSVGVNILDYYNPKGNKADGYKCEIFSIFSDGCDPFVVMKTYDMNDNVLEVFRSKKFSNTNFIKNLGTFNYVTRRLPKTFKVRIQIYDSDSNRDELIMDEQFKVKLGNELTKTIELNGKYASLNIQFNIPRIYKKPVVQMHVQPKPKKSASHAKMSASQTVRSKTYFVYIYPIIGMFCIVLILALVLIVVCRKYQRVSRTNNNILPYLAELSGPKEVIEESKNIKVVDDYEIDSAFGENEYEEDFDIDYIKYGDKTK